MPESSFPPDLPTSDSDAGSSAVFPAADSASSEKPSSSSNPTPEKPKLSPKAYIVFLLGLVGVLVVAFVIFLAVERANTSATENEKTQTPAANTPPPAETPPVTVGPDTSGTTASTSLHNYTYAFGTGFEDEWYKVTMSAKLDPARFEAKKSAQAQNVIVIAERNTKHELQVMVFNNSGAGFTSAKQFWGQGNACAICKEEMPGIVFLGVSDIAAYGTQNETWVIYFVPNSVFIVAASMPKPDTDFKAILQSLILTIEKIPNPNNQ